MNDEPFATVADCGTLWTGGIILLTSGLLLAQCCAKGAKKDDKAATKDGNDKDGKKNNKKNKGKGKGGKVSGKKAPSAPDKRIVVPGLGPKAHPRMDEPRGQEGVGEGFAYTTLGGLDKDIFAKGQGAGGGGMQAPPPPPTRAGPPAAFRPPTASGPDGPNEIDEAPRGQEGIGEGQQYQTLGNLDMDNIFGKGQPAGGGQQLGHGGSMLAAPQSMVDGQGAGGPGGAPSVNDGPVREGIGQGQDYQTWNALDQNVFVDGQKQQQQGAPAPQQSEAQSQAEAAPREGLGQGLDYQTWNNLDKDVFVK